MGDAPYVDRQIGGKRKPRDLDRAVLELARRQHGVVARRQLLALGLGPDAIDFRVRRGRLQPLYRAVYAAGHDALTREGRWLAAVLACGRGAVLSHRSAGGLWSVASVPGLDVTVPKQRRPPRGIALHVSPLPADEIARVSGVPVTGVARTLFDLATILRPRQLERAMNEAERLRLTGPLSLEHLLHRYPRRRGSRAVRALLEARSAGATLTRSELELLFLEFVDAAGLPQPRTNQLVEGVEVDFVWREQRLIVELDGYETHSTRGAFERDRARSRLLQARGWRCVQVTYRQLRDGPTSIERDLCSLLAGTLAA